MKHKRFKSVVKENLRNLKAKVQLTKKDKASKRNTKIGKKEKKRQIKGE